MYLRLIYKVDDCYLAFNETIIATSNHKMYKLEGFDL